MTQTDFERTAFYKGQKAIWFDDEVEIEGFSPLDFRVCVREPQRFGRSLGFVRCENIELLHPDPLALLREIHKRIDGDPMGEGWQTRLDSDLWEILKQILGKHGQV